MNTYLLKNQDFRISRLEDFESQLKAFEPLLSVSNASDSSYVQFPDTIYFSNSYLTDSSTPFFTFKFDNAYYHALRQIGWHVFLTLKFRRRSFRKFSDSASWNRKHYLWDLVHEVVGELDLPTNGLQYFCTEEVNTSEEVHYHVLFHRVHEEKCSVEHLRCAIERLIDPEIVQIPPSIKGSEALHVQTVRSQEKVIKYLLKKPIFQNEPKTFHLSHKFVRFWNRHMNWKSKNAA